MSIRLAALAAAMLALQPLGAAAEPDLRGLGGFRMVLGQDGLVACPPGHVHRDSACVPAQQPRRNLTEAEREQRRVERRAARQAARAAATADQQPDGANEALNDTKQTSEAAALASLLTSRIPKVDTDTPAPAMSAAATTPVVAAQEDIDLSEAIRRAAASGDVGY